MEGGKAFGFIHFSVLSWLRCLFVLGRPPNKTNNPNLLITHFREWPTVCRPLEGGKPEVVLVSAAAITIHG